MSEKPQKKMVSSIYITLSTPARAVASNRETPAVIQQHSPSTVKQAETSSLNNKASNHIDDRQHQYQHQHQHLSGQPHMGVRETDRTFPSDPGFLNGDFLPPPPPSLDNISKASDLDLPLPLPPPLPLFPAEIPVPSNNLAKPVNFDSQMQHSSAPAIALQENPLTPVEPRTQRLPSTFLKQEDANQSQTPKQSFTKLPDTYPQQEIPPSADICGFCHKIISLSCNAIEAMNKLYHADCFTCRICCIPLAGLLYYNQNGRPLCDPCYKDTLEKCAKCGTVMEKHIVRAMGQAYHPDCFTCVVCHKQIRDEQFALGDQNEVYCTEDYFRTYAPVCCVCQQPIIPKDGKDTYTIECLGQTFHENCYRCEKCGVFLSPEPTEKGCYPLNNHILCKSCHILLRTESVC